MHSYGPYNISCQTILLSLVQIFEFKFRCITIPMINYLTLPSSALCHHILSFFPSFLPAFLPSRFPFSIKSFLPLSLLFYLLSFLSVFHSTCPIFLYTSNSIILLSAARFPSFFPTYLGIFFSSLPFHFFLIYYDEKKVAF